ncbi:hypothetical protein MLD38_032803 [Melastoma candidum]|uniref:Uncharacterized protein n=1 Tax=Melastoma candidum TaxID=119954 RepID=A0ACB9M8E9_9MYRT|nr:hypothetical protein MLD38_032803 [Melastoma candidum]
MLRRLASGIGLPSRGGSSNVSGGNVNRLLYNDLCEMVPLVQILVEKTSGSSFTWRGFMLAEPKGRNISQLIPRKNKRDTGDNDSVKDGCGGSQDGNGFAVFSFKTLAAEREELTRLRDQAEDLRQKLLEKEEVLKSAEIAKGEMTSVWAQNEELRWTWQGMIPPPAVENDIFPPADKEQEMEEATLAYIAAVAMAKEKQDEESTALAAQARIRLQSFFF